MCKNGQKMSMMVKCGGMLWDWGLKSSSLACFSWVLYGDERFSGNLYVLSEGDYPNLTSMGCQPDFKIRSIKTVPMVRKHSNIKKKLSVFFPLSTSEPSPLSLSRHSQFLPSLCLVSSVWRAESSLQTQRSSAWLKRAWTTTFCLSEWTEAGKCLSASVWPFTVCMFACDCLTYTSVRQSAGEYQMKWCWNARLASPCLFLCSWVICEHSNYRGRQFLLEPIEITNWLKYSSLQTVGSMYPVRQVC